MKLAVQQLEQHLAKTIAPIYIVSSDELLLVEETVASIKQAAQKNGYTERTLITADSGSEWHKTLHSSTHSLSLFATKQLVELNMHHTKFGANTTKSLQEYAEKPAEDTVLIIRTNKVDGKTEKSVWFKTLEKNSVFIPIWPVSSQQLPQWILQRAAKRNVKLSRDFAELIATQVEGNLLAASQEIEKLSLSNTTNPAELTDNARFDVFNLVDSVLSGNRVRSLRILKSLAEEDIEPTLILWALTREFRTMAEIMHQTKQGTAFSSLCTKFNIFEKRQPAVRAFLQKNSIDTCWDLLIKSAAIDRMIKGVEAGNVWNQLESLIMDEKS